MKVLCGLCCFVCMFFLGIELPTSLTDPTTEQAVDVHDCGKVCSLTSCSVRESSKNAASCATQSACSPKMALGELTETEKKAVRFICDVIEKEKRVKFDEDEIEKAIGAKLTDSNPAAIQAGVMAELERRDFDMSTLPMSRCAKYNACSINMDLSYAEGPELERYEKERVLDGVETDPYLPRDFTLKTTRGNQVQLSSLLGKPVAVVFLAVHCSHSWDSLPILDELTNEFGEGVAILPVFTNSGTVEDVKESTSHKQLNLDYLVSEGKSLSVAFDSLIVPSTFLINRDGEVTKRLVGFKDKDTLNREIRVLSRLDVASK